MYIFLQACQTTYRAKLHGKLMVFMDEQSLTLKILLDYEINFEVIFYCICTFTFRS